ncbi:FHA domain-containing protein [bacterium]|nr:FHA domain-containing protein [bacterium]
MNGILVGALVLAAAAILVWRLRFRRRPLCRLTIREGGTLGLEFPITATEATLGSEESCTVVISHPRVSRRHAVLTMEGGEFVLRDHSVHGTSVNGTPAREAVLRSGDLIRLGDSIDVIFTRPA